MVPFNYKEFIDLLTFQVKNNIIPMSRIDDAVKRILRVKFVMGLFENPLSDTSLVSELGKQVCLNISNLKLEDEENIFIHKIYPHFFLTNPTGA